MTDNELLLAISDLMEQKISTALQAELLPIRKDIQKLDYKIDQVEKNLSQRITCVEESLNQRITCVEENLNQRITCVEESLNQRITHVEENLNQRIANVELNLQQQINQIELHLENTTDRNLQLLAENYVPAADRFLITSAKVETLQAEQDIMKKVIREHSKKLQTISL